MPSVTIHLSLPDKRLSPNARVHWRAKHAASKRARISSALNTHQIVALMRLGCPWEHATLQVRVYWPDARRRDEDNLIASLKPSIDGLVDAGLIVDDDSKHLTRLPVIFDIDRKDPRVELRLTQEHQQ